MLWSEKLNLYLTPRREHAALCGIFAVYAAQLAQKITGPFIGTSEAFTGMYGIAAWNWLVHGPFALKLAMMTPYGAQPVLPEITKIFFLNHPSFFIAPTALLYALFGVGEWQTRLAPVICSLLSLLVFSTLIRRVFGKSWLTITSSFLYALFPMSVFYGRMLTHDAITELFILLLILTIIRYEQEPRTRNLVALITTTFLGGLTDWAFLFAAGAAWWYVALRKDYPKRAAILSLLIGISVVSVGVTLVQIWSITYTNPFAFLSAIFFNRNTGFSLASIPFFFLMRINFDLIGFSEIGLLLAAIGVVAYARAYHANRTKIAFALLLLAPGAFVYIVFHGHATVHQFMGIYIIPPIALFAAWGLGKIRSTVGAGAIALIFITSCLWYSANLFAYQSFAPDDFVMLTRAKAAVPTSTAICMGENSVNTNIKFYLFPHQMDDAPCVDDAYFVLRRPESYAQRDASFSLLQTFFTNSLWQNMHSVSFAASVGMETAKSIPLIRRSIEHVFANHDPHSYYASAAKEVRAFIDDHGLRAMDCSTNFCLYKK